MAHHTSNKVFGIGLGKTGTSSLGRALKVLGYRHMNFRADLVLEYDKGNLQPIFEVADQYDSFEDFPWPLLYKELDRRYPGSKFVLTLRSDVNKWFKSIYDHANRGAGTKKIRKITYGYEMPHHHEKEYIECYLKHKEDVLHHFADRKEDLLVMYIDQGDSWGKLCDFLVKPVPNVPFPHANRKPNQIEYYFKVNKRRFLSLFGLGK
ncbi:hypothetical protein OKW21_000781 [Catalinimonas alkaloidigena]|uniref:sulfotransferase family protein n=1 Tax=Catalinimonas alkaloidigena TaxID=1075417 RepID=UPI00240628ED|nr:sulfotransferase family protein [Catalinimonas alkaloidigena]MDF9795518.1 hypothetical protein [Catalinimonas alkaloidigena]